MVASSLFGVEPSKKHDWFNTLLFRDTRVFLDPYLITTTPHPAFKTAPDTLQRFFKEAYDLGAKSGGKPFSPAAQKLKQMMLFPEPEELCLGYARQGNRGAGTGGKFGNVMTSAILEAIARGMSSLQSFDEVGLIHEGIGKDRISDITGRILMPLFATYTQNVAKRLNHNLSEFRIKKGRFNFRNLKWETLDAKLPLNPFTGMGLVLTPKRFLRQTPTVDPNDFKHYLLEEFDFEQPDAESRSDLNWQIVSELDRAGLIELARKNRFLVRNYLDTRRARPRPVPYDFEADPAGLYQWGAATQAYTKRNPLSLDATDRVSFGKCVDNLVRAFKLYVEDNSGYKLLWDSGFRKPKSEESSQLLFVGIVKAYCIANNIDLSREVNIGSGPVDFKFSAGYQSRALLEVKRANNGRFAAGFEKQLIQYLKAESIQSGYYLVIQQYKREAKRIAALQSRVDSVNRKHGTRMKVVVIDAIPLKASASKLY